MPDEADPLLAYKDIGKLLKVHPKTVRKWDRMGLLPRPSFQVLNYRRWRRSVIDAWLMIGGTRSLRGGNDREKREPKEPETGSVAEKSEPAGKKGNK